MTKLSTIALGVAPAVLGVGFLVWGLGARTWLRFGEESHSFDRQLSQEKRHAEIVKADPLPPAPLQIILPKRQTSITIQRVEIDGADLMVMLHNASNQTDESSEPKSPYLPTLPAKFRFFAGVVLVTSAIKLLDYLAKRRGYISNMAVFIGFIPFFCGMVCLISLFGVFW